MKKLWALMLSVIMAVSLAAPAFAAPAPDAAPVDGDPGFFTENGLPVPVYMPGDAIPISAILDDESIGIIGGQDGPTAIITTIPVLDLAPDMTWEELLQQQQQKLIDSTKEALGGVAGQIGVMVNGEYIKFPDAAPEIANGRTMVPVRALVETLGGEVDYQDDVVTFVLDGYAYEFAIGSTTVEVSPTADNDKDTPKPEDIEMDCAPYIKDGRTYVPIRFISEALGYEVGWDKDFQTAILLDRAALAADIDKDFTILNRVQASRVSGWEKGQSLSTGVKGSVSVTAFDTLNGNKTYKADFSSQVLMNEEAVNGSFSIKLSDNITALLVGQYDNDLDEEVQERLDLVVKALEDAEFIMNWDGQMWVKSPVLDKLGGAKDIWCGMEMDAEFGKAMFSGTGVTTMGSATAAMMDANSVMTWCQAMEAATMLDDMYGDKCFTTSGGVSTRTIGIKELAELAGMDVDEAEEELKEEGLKEFKLVMKVDSRGGATVTCTMETEAQYGMPAMKMTMDCTQSNGKADLTLNAHVANLGEMKLTLNTTEKAVDEKPMSEPPAGANVVDAPELLEP